MSSIEYKQEFNMDILNDSNSNKLDNYLSGSVHLMVLQKQLEWCKSP